MKKFFSMMMIAAAAFTFAACDETLDTPDGPVQGGQLATPELTETHTETSITVSWAAVENAEAYAVNMKGKTYNTEALSYTFENLNAGTYDIRVMAKAEGYKDSEFAKISVTITGATSVDWFTQTVANSEEDAEKGIYPYNTIDFIWQGTGVADIRYGLFVTADLEGVSDKEIKDNLQSIASDQSAAVIAEINGDGFYGQFGPGLNANTEYSLYVEVTNNDGLEFFTVNTIATENFDIPAETQAWIGEWNATTSQVVSMGVDDAGQIVYDLYAQAHNFTFTIAASSSSPNMVVVDGLSVLGEGYPVAGYVEGNTLTIVTNAYLGQNAGAYIYWLPCLAIEGQLYGINVFDSEVPAHVLTMAEDGTVTGETGKFDVSYSDGTTAVAEVICTEVFGISEKGYLQFFIEEFPAVYRAGAMEVAKAATPTAKALNREAKNLPVMTTSATPSSLVLR